MTQCTATQTDGQDPKANTNEAPLAPLTLLPDVATALSSYDWLELRNGIRDSVKNSWGLPKDACEDIAQESILIVWEKLLGKDLKAGDWDQVVRVAYGIARNKKMETRRKETKIDRIEDQPPGFNPVSSDIDVPIRALHSEEVFAAAVAKLSPQELRVLQLLLDGETYEDIPGKMKWTSRSCNQMVYNIVMKMRKKLGVFEVSS